MEKIGAWFCPHCGHSNLIDMLRGFSQAVCGGCWRTIRFDDIPKIKKGQAR
jgi:hypothetical protein